MEVTQAKGFKSWGYAIAFEKILMFTLLFWRASAFLSRETAHGQHIRQSNTGVDVSSGLASWVAGSAW
ncbi:hypothetical protein KFE96_18225 [Kordiimonas sp. SCSIO 12603]|uniref:hypothetical protein n=1 Tax=Kordiimonas sp. SCSIO 12603 TaxID=2829596 RepID=UPI002107541C|nr:hypothetical protein [Kordiimonas sp. SCSIO 12603]UTW58724.1 hypothetical protein KFE96_18225 [Kordiimonas sp. SCSIO 12603]